MSTRGFSHRVVAIAAASALSRRRRNAVRAHTETLIDLSDPDNPLGPEEFERYHMAWLHDQALTGIAPPELLTRRSGDGPGGHLRWGWAVGAESPTSTRRHPSVWGPTWWWNVSLRLMVVVDVVVMAYLVATVANVDWNPMTAPLLTIGVSAVYALMTQHWEDIGRDVSSRRRVLLDIQRSHRRGEWRTANVLIWGSCAVLTAATGLWVITVLFIAIAAARTLLRVNVVRIQTEGAFWDLRSRAMALADSTARALAGSMARHVLIRSGLCVYFINLAIDINLAISLAIDSARSAALPTSDMAARYIIVTGDTTAADSDQKMIAAGTHQSESTWTPATISALAAITSATAAKATTADLAVILGGVGMARRTLRASTPSAKMSDRHPVRTVEGRAATAL